MRQGLPTGEFADFEKLERPDSTRREFLKFLTAGVALSAVPVIPQSVSPAAKPNKDSSALSPTALVHDEICKTHVAGAGRPECPQRYEAVLAALKKNASFSAFKIFKARPATDEEILACHRKAYLAKARREIESGATRLSTGDTYVCHESLKAADYAAGAACVAVDAVLKDGTKNAFCLTRPPGHHATQDRGMGFCIFNNAAIAARYAQRKHGIHKLAIVDWDVHHGNGTQDIFYEDGSVFYFSTHEDHWYPWTGTKDETGRGKGRGANLNCPLARGAGRKEFRLAFEKWMSAMNRFKPELILISAGFDARHGDPLGQLELTDEDYIELTAKVLDIAHHHAGGRVVSILEGGYNLTGLASAAAAHCSRLQQG
jgi:acetoin utilization deacetylase AcuC-like enzyme